MSKAYSAMGKALLVGAVVKELILPSQAYAKVTLENYNPSPGGRADIISAAEPNYNHKHSITPSSQPPGTVDNKVAKDNLSDGTRVVQWADNRNMGRRDYGESTRGLTSSANNKNTTDFMLRYQNLLKRQR